MSRNRTRRCFSADIREVREFVAAINQAWTAGDCEAIAGAEGVT